jgi:hypothetical protein
MTKILATWVPTLSPWSPSGLMHSRGILEHAGYKFHWPNLRTAGADNLNNLETRCSWALKVMTSNSSGDDLTIKKERIDALLEPNVDKTVETPLLWRRGSGLLLGMGNICLCFRRAQKMLLKKSWAIYLR